MMPVIDPSARLEFVKGLAQGQSRASSGLQAGVRRGIDYKRRITLLEGVLKKEGLDSFLVTGETNVTYLSGFLGSDSALLITGRKRYLITDSRFIEDARDTVRNFEIKPVTLSTYEALEELITKNRLEKIGFEAMNLPYGVASRLGKLVGRKKLVPTKCLVEEIRTIKDACEVALIRDAIRLTKKVFDKAIRYARQGVTEESIARTIESSFIENGAEAAFRPIVASGANSSKPHARPTAGRIRDNTFLMIDLGCRLKCYAADLTRMVIFGSVADRFKQIYGIVQKAQELAIRKIRSGAKIADIDIAARGYIGAQGFGKYFGHALGHGVGMEVHERPGISKHTKGILGPGMVFTVEPAIYIPKFGGVRIEDMVLVTDSGCEVLTR